MDQIFFFFEVSTSGKRLKSVVILLNANSQSKQVTVQGGTHRSGL